MRQQHDTKQNRLSALRLSVEVGSIVVLNLVAMDSSGWIVSKILDVGSTLHMVHNAADGR